MHTTDASEKQLVSSDIDSQNTSWKAMKSSAANKLTAVETALAASNDYHRKADQLTQWLNTMEMKMAALELQTSDATTIQQQIAVQRVTVQITPCYRLRTWKLSWC